MHRYTMRMLLPRWLILQAHHHCPAGVLYLRTQNLSFREVQCTRDLCLGAELPLRRLDQINLCLSRRMAPVWGLCQRFSLFSSLELSHLICKVTVKISSCFVLGIMSHWTMKIDNSRLYVFIAFPEIFRFPRLGIQEAFEGN